MTGLPASGAPWPPKPHDHVLEACRERQVWWEGDPDKLAAYYGGQQHEYQRRGITGLWRRIFWGSPPPNESNPKRLHVPVAADLGRISASSLLSEPVAFTDPEGDEQLQARIDLILNTEDTYSRMLAAAEGSSMLSGTYGRIVWDDKVRDHAWIDWVDADRAIPTFRWGVLTEVSFWTELPSTDRTVWRHIQHYSKGRIDHALYMGTSDNIGRLVPLTEHPDTAGLADGLVDGTAKMLGVDKLAACYIPNAAPNPQWRQVPELRNLGRSDLTPDVIHLLDAIDRTWSSWMNDLEIGRGRIIASESLLKLRGPGKGAEFDLDRSIYSPIGANVKEGDEQSLLTVSQFAIRVDEHQRTFEQLLRRVISRVGYSPITFGLADEVAQTATEVDAKERDTNATRASKIRLWAPLAELATTLLAVDAELFSDGVAPTEPLEVDWPSMRQQSDASRAQTVALWEQALAATAETKVRYLHPEWDDERVQQEVDGLESAAAPPLSILGPNESNFGEPDAETEDEDAVESGDTDDSVPPQFRQ